MSGLSENLIFSLAAAISLLPATLLSLKRAEAKQDLIYWITFIVAITGPLTWTAVNLPGNWLTGLPTALWLSITASMIVFLCFHLFIKNIDKLNRLFMPLMCLFALLALLSSPYPGKPLSSITTSGWIELHIFMSLATYAVLTLGAIAALAAVLREKSLKSKKPNGFISALPSAANCDRLMTLTLKLSAAVLMAGLLTGIALDLTFYETFLVIDHKTILAITAIICITVMLFIHHQTGVRGRQAARMIFIIYLLVTLGYPGVKFVETVILG